MSPLRVLIVVHGYPPASMGGAEIYAHDLAHALHDHLGHDVFVLAREEDRGRREYAVRRSEERGVSLALVNNTYRRCRTYEETYDNEPIGAIAARVIREIRPDVAHVHHLTGLSTRVLPALAAERVPCVFTLQDYWLICHRGQLFDRTHRNCDGPYPAGCGQCHGSWARGWFLERHGIPSFPGRGILRRLLNDAASHSPDPDALRRESAARMAHMRDVTAHVSRFLAPSRTMRDRMVEFGIDPSRLRLQEQGIDLSGFRGLRHAPSEEIRFGLVGSLIVSKGPHVLLEAFEGIPSARASLHLYGAIGDYHGDNAHARALSSLLTRPYVRHHGAVPHENVPEMLASLDVLVVPSLWIENAPFVIREAFAAGVPVVASNLGGMAEMVAHERNGLLFAAGDVADLRRTLRRLLDERGLLGRLRTGIPPVKSIEEDAEWTSGVYSEVRSAETAG
jgi:glycosyltransferase involved in cell wall biosynthesis